MKSFAKHSSFSCRTVMQAILGRRPVLAQQLKEHFGSELSRFPIIEERMHSFELPNFTAAINAYLSQPDRTAKICGVVFSDHCSPGLSELALPPGTTEKHNHAREGPIQYLVVPAKNMGITCIQRALYLICDGRERLAVYFHAEDDLFEDLHLEIMASNTTAAELFLKVLHQHMQELNVYRGKTLSLNSGTFGNLSLLFQQLPDIARPDIILPPGLLERIERQTLSFAKHSAALAQNGHHLKRGILFHGQPGTGKTLTAMYLAKKMPGYTTILLTAEGLSNLEKCCTLAKSLQPAIIILEDVDLVAEERTKRSVSMPALFTLLNQMDGLAPDANIFFLLTTNRPEILEPALASRPGRIDQAFEIPMPDDDCRRRLINLYAHQQTLKTSTLDDLVKRTQGASAAFIRELMRRATLLALEENSIINSSHYNTALNELLNSAKLNKRILGFQTTD